MKIKKFYLISVFIIIILISNCMKIDMTVNISKDGSGTIETTDMFTKNIIEQFGQMMGDKLNSTTEESLKKDEAKYGEGVKYVSREEISDKVYQGVKAVYSFNDVGKLMIEPFFESETSSSSEPGETTVKSSMIFDLKKNGNTNILTITIPKQKEEEKVETENNEPAKPQDIETTKMLMKDMYLGLKVKVDGKITKTNARHVDGNTISLWVINFNELIKDDKIFTAFNEAEGDKDAQLKILQSLKGIKIEDQDKITIEFE